MPIFHRSNLRSETTGGQLLNFDSIRAVMDRAVEIAKEEAPEYSGEDPRRIIGRGSLKQSLRGILQQSENSAAIIIEADQKELWNTRTNSRGTRDHILSFVLHGTTGGQTIIPTRKVPTGLPRRGAGGRFNKQTTVDPTARLAFYWKANPLHLFIMRYVTRGDTPPNRFDLNVAKRMRGELTNTRLSWVKNLSDNIWLRMNNIGGSGE